MHYDYDVIVIGLGPAGMAVSIMAAEMGLKVCGIEKHRIGGECMNVGCIPSKALLRMAKSRQVVEHFEQMALGGTEKPAVQNPFERIGGHLDYIREKKTMKMFEKVDLVYQQGAAEFVDGHTVLVGQKSYTGRRIYICTGTRPQVPDFEGIHNIDYLTNDNLFSLSSVPESMIVVGGGAIACEMAQAFARLGSEVTMIIRGPRLMWREDQDATDVLEERFEQEGIRILREQKPVSFAQEDAGVRMVTDKGDEVLAEKVLIAAGRVTDYRAMRLDKAGVNTNDRGEIVVNQYLQTNQKHIYGVGDCNGYYQLSHAAMHQGMLALMNGMMPWPMKQQFSKYVVPWTVFTEPQLSHVGMTEKELKEKGIDYEVTRVNYNDYGAAIAEGVDTGFLKVFASKAGRIYGAYIIGEGSGEMVNEWGLAIQKKIRLHDIMMLQHSFPTMGFMSKRVAETWMMKRMESGMLKKMAQFFFRF